MDLMRSAVPQDSDPNGANIVIQRVPDRPKRDLIDVEMCTRTGIQATVSVIPSWRDKGALQIELTQENMDLMLEEPPAESAHDPNIAYFPDASWISGRNHVRCTYSKRKVWRIKPQGVEYGCDDAAAEKKQQHLLPRRPPNNSIIIDDNCDTMACSWGEGEPLPKRLNQPMHSAESTHSNATGTDG